MDRTLATRALAAAFVVGAIAQALLFSLGLGVNVLLLAALLIGAGAAISGRARRIDSADVWIPVAAIAISAGFAIRSDPMIVFLDAVTAMTLLGASMAAFAGAAITRRSALAITAAGAVVVAFLVVGILRLTEVARRREPGPSWRSRIPPAAVPVVRGLVIALPILFVFSVLFSSADAIFASVTERLFNWQVDFGELPMRASLAFLIAWVVAGLFAVALGGADRLLDEPAPVAQSLGAAVTEPLPLLPRLGATEALTILIAVDVLFGSFVLLQVAYLFGGLDTLTAGGITYSSYARRGFFELVAVTGLAGGLVVGLHALVVHRTRGFVIAAVALSLLTFAVLFSAAFRLRLYQEAYGWTELRFYIYATIAWLGLGIVAAVVLLARDRMRWLPHAMAMTAVGVLLAANVIGPLRFVAEQNVARLLDPSLVPADGRIGLDVDYALGLNGDDAVPAFVAALPALSDVDRAFVLKDLEYRWEQLQQPELTGWPAWNLAREQARAALEPLFAR
jgi:hypothetical protein